MSGVWAIVVAAGRGERLGLPYNKVFYRLGGRSILHRCLDALQRADCLDGAVLVLSAEDRDRYDQLCAQEGPSPLVRFIVEGGRTRQESVQNGLAVLPPEAQIVAIHDAARAFVPADVVQATIDSAMRYGSGVAATHVIDTVKSVDAEGWAEQTLDRTRLRLVQTPQTFSREIIEKAHAAAHAEGFAQATDDAMLVERYHGPVHLVETQDGSTNFKLTTMGDLELARARLNETLRVGHGYDAHRLVEGRPLVLCGVEIPCEKGLLGHSDADVALHALMDALLGAAALGDIGRHFPDSDPQYRGICSLRLLEKTAELLRRQGLYARNVDVTIVAQRPKLMNFMPRMRESIAQALGLALNCVSVKATTTEGMGFEGSGEGMSASAVALIGA